MPASLISQQNMDILILEDWYATYPMVTEHNIYAYININWDSVLLVYAYENFQQFYFCQMSGRYIMIKFDGVQHGSVCTWLLSVLALDVCSGWYQTNINILVGEIMSCLESVFLLGILRLLAVPWDPY